MSRGPDLPYLPKSMGRNALALELLLDSKFGLGLLKEAHDHLRRPGPSENVSYSPQTNHPLANAGQRRSTGARLYFKLGGPQSGLHKLYIIFRKTKVDMEVMARFWARWSLF